MNTGNSKRKNILIFSAGTLIFIVGWSSDLFVTSNTIWNSLENYQHLATLIQGQNLFEPTLKANDIYPTEHCQPLAVKLLDGYNNNTIQQFMGSVAALLDEGEMMNATNLLSPFALYQLQGDIAINVETIVTFFKEKHVLYLDPTTDEGDDHVWATEKEYEPPSNELTCWNNFRYLLM